MSTTEVGTCVFPINKILTHTNPHIDEICGIWLLRKFGGNHFRGIASAPLEFRSGGNTKFEMTAEEYLEQGILLVGIGGGMFDEHPTVDAERKKEKCAATLIAEYLGVNDNPELDKILDFVRRNDLNGNESMFDIGSICLKMYSIMSTEKVILWATLALETIYREQDQFNRVAAEELKKARIYSFRSRGSAIKIAAIESDNEVVAKFARSARGGNIAIVIQKQNSGNVQIFLNRRFGWIPMQKIARFIRLAEARFGGKAITTDKEILEREGSVQGAEDWHFFKKGQMLLNGSSTHPDVPPTKIPFGEIAAIICRCI